MDLKTRFLVVLSSVDNLHLICYSAPAMRSNYENHCLLFFCLSLTTNSLPIILLLVWNEVPKIIFNDFTFAETLEWLLILDIYVAQLLRLILVFTPCRCWQCCGRFVYTSSLSLQNWNTYIGEILCVYIAFCFYFTINYYLFFSLSLTSSFKWQINANNWYFT
jgi:hypothetical protein